MVPSACFLHFNRKITILVYIATHIYGLIYC
jgi:hypothetical protein